MTPIQVVKYGVYAAAAVAMMMGWTEAAAWYFSFILSASVLAGTLYSIYIIVGLEETPTETPAVETPAPTPHDDLLPLIHRSEYRDMIREFVRQHVQGACCGALSRDEITLMNHNIQHTQQSMTTVSYNSVEEFNTKDRIEAVFSTTGSTIQLLMGLAAAVSNHRVDGVHCDKYTVGRLCLEIRKSPLLRDIYGDGVDVVDTIALAN